MPAPPFESTVAMFVRVRNISSNIFARAGASCRACSIHPEVRVSSVTRQIKNASLRCGILEAGTRLFET